MFTINGESYQIDQMTLKLWEIWVCSGTPRFEHNADYLQQFKGFCQNILDILKTDEKGAG